MNLRIFATALALLSATVSSHATTIQYTLTNVGLTLGVGGPADGTLNGTFSVNDSTNTLTLLNVTASPGIVAPFTGGGFDFIFGGASPNSTVAFENSSVIELTANSGNDVLELSFGSALNGSGPDTIASGTYEDEITGASLRNVGSGYSATLGSIGAAPEPSSIAFLGTGLLAVGGLLRRRLVSSSPTSPSIAS